MLDIRAFAQCSGGFRALGRQLAPGRQASKMSLQEGLSGGNLGRGGGCSVYVALYMGRSKN